jgi:uncharacterized iron-regulated protein
MKLTMPPMATMSIEGVSGRFRIGQVIHVETGKAISFDELIHQLESKELIFIGEVHDNPEHHLIQVQILQALMAKYGPMTVAMEFFHEAQQQDLDQYLEGSVTEMAFLEDVGWDKGWGFDYHFYRPIMLLAKEKRGRILAINSPDDIVRKVARSGLSSLEPDERDHLATEIDLNNQNHRAYLFEIYKQHEHPDLKDFDYFYQAQCVWEDTMAENIAEYLRKDKQRVVVFAGNGHIINKYGIPDRATRRIPVSMGTIVLYPLTDSVTMKKEIADYIWLTRSY